MRRILHPTLRNSCVRRSSDWTGVMFSLCGYYLHEWFSCKALQKKWRRRSFWWIRGLLIACMSLHEANHCAIFRVQISGAVRETWKTQSCEFSRSSPVLVPRFSTNSFSDIIPIAVVHQAKEVERGGKLQRNFDFQKEHHRGEGLDHKDNIKWKVFLAFLKGRQSFL